MFINQRRICERHSTRHLLKHSLVNITSAELTPIQFNNYRTFVCFLVRLFLFFIIGILLSLAYTNIHSFLTPFVNFKIYFELFPIFLIKWMFPYTGWICRIFIQIFYQFLLDLSYEILKKELSFIFNEQLQDICMTHTIRTFIFVISENLVYQNYLS